MTPFVPTHTLKGVPFDYKRVDTPVEVLGQFGSERHYFRVRLPNGRIVIASDSMLSPGDPGSVLPAS